MTLLAQALFEPLLPSSIERVLLVEQRAYVRPWSHLNFLDSLNAGYQAQMLVAGGSTLSFQQGCEAALSRRTENRLRQPDPCGF